MRSFALSDLTELNRWLEARGASVLASDVLPSFGLIEPGVAAGFLYRTDSSVVLLDGFVTCPGAPARVRHRAVRAIAAALREEALEGGARHVIGLTRSRGMARAVGRAGFQSIGVYEMVEG